MFDRVILFFLAAGAGMSLWLFVNVLAGAVAGARRELRAVRDHIERLLSGRG